MRADGSADTTAGAPGPTVEPITRVRGELRLVPRAVWALVGLQLALLAVYSVLMPTYRAPDEPQNLDIVFAATSLTAFSGEHREMSPMVVGSYPYALFDMEDRKEPVPPTPALPRGDRPAFAELADARTRTGAPNQQWQHPPLYPATMGAALTVLGALVPPVTNAAFDQTVGLARLLNALMVAPLPLLAYLTARRLGSRHTTALAAAVVPVTVPQLTHIGAAVNHDNLLILLTGLVTVLVAGVLRGDGSRRTALTLGVLAGLALLTKGFGLAVPVWVGGIYLLAGVRYGVRVGVRGAMALGVAGAIGSWWWLRNLAVHGVLQPTGVHLPDPPPGFVADGGGWLGWMGEALAWRFWGNFGWFQAPLPGWAPAAAATLAAVTFVVAFGWRRAGDPGRGDLLAMVFPSAAIAGIVAYGGWRYYVATAHPIGVQGRYLFSGLVGLAAVSSTGLTALPDRAARWAPVGVLGAAVVLHGVAAHTILRAVWGAGELVTWSLAVRAVGAWAPWPVWVQAAGLLALVGGLGTAAVTLVRAVR